MLQHLVPINYFFTLHMHHQGIYLEVLLMELLWRLGDPEPVFWSIFLFLGIYTWVIGLLAGGLADSFYLCATDGLELLVCGGMTRVFFGVCRARFLPLDLLLLVLLSLFFLRTFLLTIGTFGRESI